MTAPRPLSTWLIDATVGTLRYTAVDIDEIARRVFPRIEGEAAEKIAAELVRARGGSIESLAKAYEESPPLRGFPVPPQLFVQAAPAPLPAEPKLDDAMLWTMSWSASAILEGDDRLATDDGAESLLPTRNATAFERALLACHAANDDELPVYAAILAETAIIDVELPPRIDASGANEGSTTFDIRTTKLTHKRAVLTRNPKAEAESVYCAAQAAEVIAPFIDRYETLELPALVQRECGTLAEFLEPLLPLASQRIEVHYVLPLGASIPVALAIAPVDAQSMAEAMSMWLEQQMPETDGAAWKFRILGDEIVLHDVRLPFAALR
ncbi:MAG TPA: hypothetical protein VFN10_03610 [Thermoanaerobaculia bacterium]|nr:hypothetical protein [Thermoanaerobaculia bacterium]